MDGQDLKNVIEYWMEGEISNFIKVWVSAYISLTYCYIATNIFPRGAARLAAFLPVVALFLLLPLHLHTMHLAGTTAFFLAWLASFKLLMLAFDKGPLSNPSINLPTFLALACLPVKLREEKKTQSNSKWAKSAFNYGVKVVLFALLLKVYDYDDYIHPKLMKVIYSIHVYLSLEIILAVAAAVAGGMLGAELEPQFNEPYLSTSLQDFWGRRWNLMVTRILRPTVYLPALKWSEKAVGRVGPRDRARHTGEDSEGDLIHGGNSPATAHTHTGVVGGRFNEKEEHSCFIQHKILVSQ